MASRHSPKMSADHSLKSDWNTVATFGALNSARQAGSPLISPIIRSDPFDSTSPYRSPDVKPGSTGAVSPIPSHLTLDRRARVSDRSSCEDPHYRSGENSVHSSGFLTPPSRNSSPSHSDHVGARARLPPPMEPTPAKRVVADTANDNWHWLRYPKLKLSDYQLKSYLWLPVSKDDPRPAHIESRKPSGFAGRSSRNNRSKAVAFNFDDVRQSIDRMHSTPATPTISRRWSSTGLDKAITRGGSLAENYLAPERRQTIPFSDRGAEVLSAVKERLTRRSIYGHQMETPTIITLRRASAVLGTVAQRQMSITGDPTPTLPAKWQQASPEVPLAAYLITADEIHTLASLIRRTFADGTLPESSRALETVGEDEQKPVTTRSRTGSMVNRGKVHPEKTSPANVAITVADVHSLTRSNTMSNRGNFMSQMSRKTSIVSTMLARKSVHEIIWEDDGTPQSLRSSTWNLSNDAQKNDVATWSSNAFRRESGETGISVTEEPAQPSPSSGETSGKASQRPPTFKPVFGQRPKSSAKDFRDSKYARPPHWKKDSIHELPFPGVLLEADERETPASMPIPIDDVISFPPLPQRQHTSEWQVPPADIETPVATPNQELPNIFLRHPSSAKSVPVSLKVDSSEEEDDNENTLYRYGVDATIPSSVSRTSSTAPTSPTPIIKTTLWGSDEPPVFGPQAQRRRSSAMPQPNILKRKVSNSKIGSSLGASSGARRRSSTRAEHIRIAHQKVEREEGRAPWRKARKDSGYPGLAPPSSDEGSDLSGAEDAAEGRKLEAQALLGKKGKGKSGMVLQLPMAVRKIKRIVGSRVTEEEEVGEVEREQEAWEREKTRSPSPTRKTFGVFGKRLETARVGCGRAECTRVGCGGSGSGHSRPVTPARSADGSRPNSPGKARGRERESGEEGVYTAERTGTGTYVLCKSPTGSR